MDGLFHVITLHVRENPHVAWVLAKRIAGIFPLLGAPIRTLAGVFLRYPNGIKIEGVFVSPREPKNRLMPPRKPQFAV